MINKRGQVLEFLMNYGWVILIVIFGIGLLSSFFYLEKQPTFEIYIEECYHGDSVDGGFNINNYYASVVLNLTKHNLHSLINGDENITCDEHICEVSRTINPLVCKNANFGGFKFEHECFKNGSFRENPDGCLVLFELKYKEDLTIDWLEENCECSTMNNDYDEDFSLYCNKYKCGEFFVEVLK